MTLPFMFECSRAQISPRLIGPKAARSTGISNSVPCTAFIRIFTSASEGIYSSTRFFFGKAVFSAIDGLYTRSTADIRPCMLRTVLGDNLTASRLIAF